MVSQQQRSVTTRHQILAAFRKAFLDRGFEKTTTAQVLSETGLSKGAMYHHFRSKMDIVESLYETEVCGAIARATAAIDASAPALSRLTQACLAWTREVEDPDVARMLFEIGPSALGYKKARKIEDAQSLTRLEALLSEAVENGDLRPVETKLIASMLNALLAEAVVHSLKTGTDISATLEQVLESVLSPFRCSL